MNYLVHASWGLFLLAYLVRDILYLRDIAHKLRSRNQ